MSESYEEFLRARGLTKENLEKLYLEENETLAQLCLKFEMTPKRLRRALSFYGIKKDPNVWRRPFKENTLSAQARAAEAARNLSKEQKVERARRAGASRRENRKAALEKKGITHASLIEHYINQNISLVGLANKFGVSKAEVRSWLSLFQITKSRSLRDAARLKGLPSYKRDAKQMAQIVEKRNKTVAERYGNGWYRVNTSREEEELLRAITLILPGMQILSGEYGVIKKSTGHPLQLDIYVPAIRLAIEYNGEYWHDRLKFEQDLRDGVAVSQEAVKLNLCEEADIELIHVWSSDWKRDRDSILTTIGDIACQRIEEFITTDPEFMRDIS